MSLDPAAIQDRFQELGPVRTRRMFGGLGIFLHDQIFAIEAGGEIYLKADAQSLDRFQAAGSRAFTYEKDGRPYRMSYWLLPAAAADDPSEAAIWGRLGLEAAWRAASGRKPKARR